MKLCIKCKYCKRKFFDYYCLQFVNPVDGSLFITCMQVRIDDESCGRAARFWEKVEVKE